MGATVFSNGVGSGFVALGQRIQRHGWPAVTGCALLVAAGLCAAGAWYAHAQVLETNKFMALMQKTQKAAVRNTLTSNEPLPQAPPDSMFLEDLRTLLTLANKYGVSLGVVEYKTERNDKLPLTMRTIELKVKEDYPKIKGFLSQVLADFPFASLQEIRVERTDGLAVQGTLLIRLMLVYKSSDGSPDAVAIPTPALK